MYIVTIEDGVDDRIVDHRPRADSISDRAPPPQRPEFWRLPDMQIVPRSDVPERDIDRNPFITPGPC